MIKVNIAEAKAKFSTLIRAARDGEEVVVCDHNVPVVTLTPIRRALRTVVPLGPDDPGIKIPDSFFDALPPELQRAWEGHDD